MKLKVSDGQEIFYECSGNPDGLPALYLHGGPGAGCSPGALKHFDPQKYRIVMLDQRGSGRSRPLDADLEHNTTQHLLADIEALREHLGVKSWTILGVSWGTTLGLAYAQTFPERVRALVLALVVTTSRREVDWVTEGVGCLFPREWERFASIVPDRLRHLRLVDAYAEMLQDPDTRKKAALEWCLWEDAHVSLSPGHRPNPSYDDAKFRLRFARLVTHYWRHSAFLEEDQLLRNAELLNGIPGVLIHGRFDVSSPLDTAWQLSRRWKSSRLQVLDDMGHGNATSFPESIRAALDAI